jgi:hypothetical protein
MSFVFDLDEECRQRLAALAESCKTNGQGMLATADYHGQGFVHVPAQWLSQLLREASTSPDRNYETPQPE